MGGGCVVVLCDVGCGMVRRCQVCVGMGPRGGWLGYLLRAASWRISNSYLLDAEVIKKM
jgi:hypothetical protein